MPAELADEVGPATKCGSRRREFGVAQRKVASGRQADRERPYAGLVAAIGADRILDVLRDYAAHTLTIGRLGDDGIDLVVADRHQRGEAPPYVRVLDVANPTQPREIAYYNNFRSEDPLRGLGFYEGAIGIRVPKVPDVTAVNAGLLYVVDTSRGLLILRETK